MTDAELLESLLELSRDLGLEVRVVGAGPAPGSDGPPTSAVCRIRGELWVVLSTGDPAPSQIDALARGLRSHAGAALEERYLPPAVRQLLLGDS